VYTAPAALDKTAQ